MKQNLKKIIYFIILSLTALWCFLILLAPYLKANHSAYNFFIYIGFSKICHQIPERSFYIWGEKLAVCERCTAIYFSFLLGIALYPLLKKLNEKYLRLSLYFSTIFIVIDFLFGYINLQNIYTLLISGFLFGFCSSFFVVYGLINSFTKQK